jgi:hypothetical protein
MQYATRKSLEGFYINATSPFWGFFHQGFGRCRYFNHCPIFPKPEGPKSGFQPHAKKWLGKKPFLSALERPFSVF